MKAKPSKLTDKIGAFTVVPNAFIKDATISHEAFRLFVVLRQFAGANDDAAFPSYDTLKERTGIKSYSTIAKALRELGKKGWLERQKRFGASTIYTLTTPSIPTPDVAMEDSPVLHGVESITTRDVGHYYTPSQTTKNQFNKNQLKRESDADAPRPQNTPTATDTPSSSDAVTQSPAPNIAPKLDPIQHMIERQAQARTPAKIINQWQGAEYLKALCIAFADVMNVEVTKADRAKWMGGAARLYELHPTQTELVQARDHAARCDYALTHPAAACETIKAIRQKARPQALAHPQPSVHQVVSYTVKEQVYDD